MVIAGTEHKMTYQTPYNQHILMSRVVTASGTHSIERRDAAASRITRKTLQPLISDSLSLPPTQLPLALNPFWMISGKDANEIQPFRAYVVLPNTDIQRVHVAPRRGKKIKRYRVRVTNWTNEICYPYLDFIFEKAPFMIT
jgi:hypothetical protein